MNNPLRYEQARSLVFEALAKPGGGNTVGGVADAVQTLVGQRGIQANRYQVKARVLSTMWDLIVDGIVRPGLNDGMNEELGFFHITEYGEKVLKSGAPTPHDPTGYLDRIRREVPKADPVILMYLNESLHAFRINCGLAAMVTLGCASEKAFLLLVDAYTLALPQPRQDAFRKDTQGRLVKRVFDEFNKRFESHLKAQLPDELKDVHDATVSGVFSLIRDMRNDAGHPSGKVVDRDVVHSLLVVFPAYLRRTYALIDWLDGHHPLK